jgi:C-terminal processing protease CtpA/Prc
MNEQVADFIRANKRHPVIDGQVIGRGGQGAIYELSNGHIFKLTAEEIGALPPEFPRWKL